MKTAVSSFLSLHQLTGDAASAPAFFRISCPAVQHVLYERFHPSRPGRTYERVNLKPPVKMLELEKRSKDETTPTSDLAPVLFKRKEASRVVADMISVIEDSLIKGRTPELRVQVIIKKFVEHPDIRKVLRFMDQSASTLSAREQTAR
jgi:hypothetical protein